MGDTAGICGWWNDFGFIWHKLGFNMNLGYGTCCSFNLCKYDGGDFLTWEQTCVSKAILGRINGGCSPGAIQDDIRLPNRAMGQRDSHEGDQAYHV